MSTLGILHVLASEIPDGLSCWRLQVRVDDPSSAATTPIYETLLVTDGDLKRIRERTAKRPTTVLPAPAPVVLAAVYDAARADIAAARADCVATQASLDLAKLEVAQWGALYNTAQASLVDARLDLATTRDDLETAHVDLVSVRADLSSTKMALDADRDALRAAVEAADTLRVQLAQSERLRAAEATIVLPPWTDLGRAIKRVLGL